MKEHLVLKNYIKTRIRDYIFLILTATILLIFLEKKSFSQENIFIIDEVEVSGRISTDFNREKFINKAFKDSYKISSNTFNKYGKNQIKIIRQLSNDKTLIFYLYPNIIFN